MADYYPLLERAVSSLPDPTPENRRAIYDRARKALIAQLQNVKPAVASTYIDRECHALDLAVARLEAAMLKAPPQPVPSAQEAKTAPRAGAPERARPPSLPLSGVQRTPMNNAARPVARPPVFPPSPTPQKMPSVEPNFAPSAPDVMAIPVKSPDAPSPPPPAVMSADASPDAPDGQLGRFGRARADDLDADSERREGRRPIAITPPRTPHPMKRIAILGVILLVAAVAVAGLAIRLKDNPQDYARARTPVSTQEAESQETGGKIVDRVGSGEALKPAPPVVAAVPVEPALPTTQRAAILVEAPDDPQKVKTFIGTTLWRVEGSGASSVLVADINLPEAGLTANMRMTRNADPKLPASHTIEIRFSPAANSEVSSITTIDTPQMRIEDSPTGAPLAGAPVPIMPNYFLIGLSNNDKMSARNMELLRDRSWIDIPMALSSGRIAKLTFEKGPSGDRAITQAVQAWGP